MKRFLPGILFLGLSAVAGILCSLNFLPVGAETENNELFYTFNQQKISLTQRQDVIGVTLKKDSARRVDSQLYFQLQQNLINSQNKKANSLNAEVTPLGQNYALVSIPSEIRGNTFAVQQWINKQGYVDRPLPVVSRKGLQEKIIIPNEIIVSFQENISESQKRDIFSQKKLKVIRQVAFNQNSYVVKPESVSGTGVLQVANQLLKVKGVKSATPNFIIARNLEIPSVPEQTQGNFKGQDRDISDLKTNLLPLQWHLNSSNLINYYKLQILRTDIRATEAWKISNRGKGVTVAVLDSYIQWDHSDLRNNVYRVDSTSKKFPGEVHGWDFVDNDPDTRIGKQEIGLYKSRFQDSFTLTDEKLLEKYPELAISVKRSYRQLTRDKIANIVRLRMRSSISNSLFHGTLVSGVIAARPKGKEGVLGVAPDAKILPVRVCGEKTCGIEDSIEGIYYAAMRGADVINMSFGFYLPNDALTEAIQAAQKHNPSLVIVAAAGNEQDLEVSYPSGIQGVVSVGATNLFGNRAIYSNFGNRLDLVAPGGDIEQKDQKGNLIGGILTTSGTSLDAFWQGIQVPNTRWGNELDPKGKYVWTGGTSFSSPVVAGVVALMKSEDSKRRLKRDELISILKKTSGYEPLKITNEELRFYQSLVQRGFIPESISVKQYFFGSGLVNAEAAVGEVKIRLGKRE